MLLYQVVILALVQGITEFLPISSSAHLILPSQVLNWPDQGLAFDLAVHLGTLIAVVLYLRSELIAMIKASVSYLFTREVTQDFKLALLVVLATLPAVVIGFFVKDFVEFNLRSIVVIALASIGFGILLAIVDLRASCARTLGSMNNTHAILVGFAQALAFIPGTSRSGITITAALALGYERKDALRFSFLLSIPLILAGSFLCFIDLLETDSTVSIWKDISIGILVSGVSAYLCMHWFITWVNKLGMMPFVIYRVVLGLVLLLIYFQAS